MDNIEVDADELTRAFRDALAQAIRDAMLEDAALPAIVEMDA
jgi:hypothetical protein